MNNTSLLIHGSLFQELCSADKRDLSKIAIIKNKKVFASDDITYSSLMRQVADKYPKEILIQFKKIFKDTFDQAVINGKTNPEEIALQESVKFIDGLKDNIGKVASAIEMGDAVYAGRYIAEIISFLMRRISPQRRDKSINGLKRKIHMLNEYDIANKKIPASASLGQAISLTKNILMMHSPHYVRAVLNSIVRNL